MSVLFFCIVKPQSWENGVLMKEVACLCGCQAGMSIGRVMLFSLPGQPWKLRLHLTRRSAALVEEALWVSPLCALA